MGRSGFRKYRVEGPGNKAGRALGDNVPVEQMNGYTVAYERDELPFSLYALGLVAVAFVVIGMLRDLPLLALLGVFPLAGVFYNLPLLETGKPRLGAGQYGLFLEGLGLIAWRGIEAIDLVPDYVRGTLFQELHVTLRLPLDQALIADWRRRPFPRSLMRLAWRRRRDGVLRIPLDIMDQPPGDIHATLQRIWRFHRGR